MTKAWRCKKFKYGLKPKLKEAVKLDLKGVKPDIRISENLTWELNLIEVGALALSHDPSSNAFSVVDLTW